MLDFDLSSALRLLAISFVPALLGIILHEVAHGWMARRCGDTTAQDAGRLTLNPIPHIDPMGLAVFGLTSLSGSFVFGWAKPVPVDPRHFREPARDLMLVSLAGPMTNFLLAIIFGFLLMLTLTAMPIRAWEHNLIYAFCVSSMHAGVIINFGLGWLNLIPIPPLDGSKILAYFLPRNMVGPYMRLGRYGLLVLLLCLVTGALGLILGPLVRYSTIFLFTLLDL